MKKILFSILFLLFAVPGYSQVTATVQWNMQESPATAQTFTYTLKIDAAAPTTLTPVTCSTVNGVSTCSASVANYTVGVHTVILTASNANGSSSGTFVTGANPSVPTAGKVIVIIIQ